MSRETNDVLRQALEYYLGKVKNEKATEGIEPGIDLIRRDNLGIEHAIEEILEYLKTGLTVSQIVTIESRRHVICDALDAYEIGLRASREAYWKNIGAHPRLRSTDDAISTTQGLKREYCSGRVGSPAPSSDNPKQ